MNDVSKVIVIMTTFNGERYVEEQLLSILNQKNVDLDIFIFDDCSTDKTVDVIQSLNSNKVRLFINEVATGSAGINFLQALISLGNNYFENYDYVALADQDDLWDIEKLVRAVDELKKTSSVLYCSNLTLWNERRGTRKLLRKDYPQTQYDYLFEGGSAGCTYVFTIDFARRLVKQLEVIEYKNWPFLSHDWLIYFYARVNDDLVYFDSNSYILYRIHDKNVHGHLNVFSFHTILAKSRLVRRGWYICNIRGFRQLMANRPKAIGIYDSYERNWKSRLWVCLKFNFRLMRSKKKFFNFFLISMSVFPTTGGKGI